MKEPACGRAELNLIRLSVAALPPHRKSSVEFVGTPCLPGLTSTTCSIGGGTVDFVNVQDVLPVGLLYPLEPVSRCGRCRAEQWEVAF